MNKGVTNKIIRGTNGRLWMNDKLLANVKSFECKVKLNMKTLMKTETPSNSVAMSEHPSKEPWFCTKLIPPF